MATAPLRTKAGRITLCRCVVVPFIAGIATFAAVYVVDAFLALIKLHAEATILDDILIGILVGVMVMLLERQHQKELRREQLKVAVIQEMNHHIRNALQAITYATFKVDDKDTSDKLREASARIEWALREILPGEFSEEKNGELERKR